MFKTIRFCPGCAQRCLQMNAAPCAVCGRVNAVEAPKPRDKTHIVARAMRGLLKPLGWRTHILTVVFCVLVLGAMGVHWITPFMGIWALAMFGLGLLLVAQWLIRIGGRVAVWLFAPATRQNKRPGGRTFLVLPVCLMVLMLLNRFDVPLRVGFWLSRAALETQARAGLSAPKFRIGSSWGSLLAPSRAGLYRVKLGEYNKSSARMEVADNSFFSGKHAGFAKCPQGCGAVFAPIPSDYGGAPSYLHLAGDWYWWEQSGDTD